MNRPSRTEDTVNHQAWNQNHSPLNSDTTTRQDLIGISNEREHRSKPSQLEQASIDCQFPVAPPGQLDVSATTGDEQQLDAPEPYTTALPRLWNAIFVSGGIGRDFDIAPAANKAYQMKRAIMKFAQFIGPGFLISVAYIDPGNYATDVAAGAETKYALLFIILMSNLFATVLQSLCIKLGSVTGLNLAENCREHLPPWLNMLLYIFAESAIIATDIAEVVGSAIALNLLFKVPLVAGCVITLIDVLMILIFYRPQGSLTTLRIFEFFVMGLVIGVVICFGIQLSMIKGSGAAEIFRGYLPSAAIVESNGLYLSCGILGATVMPHSIFLGSGVVQSRLRQFDIDKGYADESTPFGSTGGEIKYRPSLYAIKSCLNYSVVELVLSLFTFALFVNSSILIVAGSSLSGISDIGDADLFGIYKLLSTSISPASGPVFAISLLLSGISAGIVCTIAGQMVSEGMLNWSISPWLRRLITRSISIVPSVIIAGYVGKEGLNATLTASQVVLSAILPFVTAPLIYFTCRKQYMTVSTGIYIGESSQDAPASNRVTMANGWLVTCLATAIWLIITVMNVALLVLVGIGKA